MGIKQGSRAHLVGTPAAAFAAMQLPALVESPELDGEFDYLHLFTTSRASLEGGLPNAQAPRQSDGDAVGVLAKSQEARHRSLLADSDQTRVLERVGREHLLERGRHLVGPQVHTSEEGQELPQQPRCATSDVTVGFRAVFVLHLDSSNQVSALPAAGSATGLALQFCRRVHRAPRPALR